MKPSDLSEFFNLLGKAKKEKEEEFDNLLKEADINLDDLTSSLVSGIKEAKEDQKKQKKNEEKLIEQLDSIIDVIENPKEVKDITEPAVTVGVPEDFDVTTLEDADDNETVEIIDIIKPEPIKTPEISDTVAQAIKFIEETNIKEEIEKSDDTNLDKLKTEIKQVRDILYKVLAHGPGSGEVRVLKMDDVDEDSAKVDGKVLQYQSSSGKFVGVGMASTDNVRTGILDVAGFATFRDGVQFDGNVSIAGTLTYEDVTNVDSVGLITARGGIKVGSGITLSPDGDGFYTGIVTATSMEPSKISLGDNERISVGLSSDLSIYHDGSQSIIADTGTGQLAIRGGVTVSISNAAGTEVMANFINGGAVNLFHNGTNRLATTNTGVDITGDLETTSDVKVGSGVTLSPDGDIFVVGVSTFVGNLEIRPSNGQQTPRIYYDDSIAEALIFQDNVHARFGGSSDLRIYHDGSHSYVSDQGTGQLKILSSTLSVKDAGDNTVALEAVPTTHVKLFYNGSNKLETTNTGVDITGILNASDGIKLTDAENLSILLGASEDMRIRHTGSHSEITDEGTGHLRLGGGQVRIGDATFSKNAAIFDASANTRLYFDNTLRFETASTGAVVTGILTATTSSVVGTDGAFTIGAVSSHHLTVANDNASMILGKSNSDALYLRREYATGRYTFQTFNGGNDGSIALQPFGGKVGIASAIPTSTLDVNGDVRVGSGITLSPDGDVFTTGISTFTGTVGFGTHITLEDDAEIRLGERVSGGNRVGDFIIRHDPDMFSSIYNVIQSNNGNIQIENRDTNGATRFMYLKSDAVQLRTYTGNEAFIQCTRNQDVKLYYDNVEKLATSSSGAVVYGDLTVSGSVSEGSDIRLKTNIKPIEDAIDKVTQIEGVSFNWKKDNKPSLGVIADQVEKIIPELVQGDDPKTVNYNGLIGLLIEAVKDQQTQIDSLKERLSKLE